MLILIYFISRDTDLKSEYFLQPILAKRELICPQPTLAQLSGRGWLEAHGMAFKID